MCVRDEKEDAPPQTTSPPDQRQHGIPERACSEKGTTANGDTCAQARMRMTYLRASNSTPGDSFPTAGTNHLTDYGTCKPALADEPNCSIRCRDLHCTLPCRVLRESTTQLLGNEYQNPGKLAVYPPPESVGPHTGCCRSKLNDICVAASKAHALDPGPDAFHRREAINAQQTTASPAKAPKGRP